jgi:hypothetical protein
MEFFAGFMTAFVLFAIFFCMYVFLQEEIKKRKISNIVPGQSYYVQSIGKVLIKKVDEGFVTYESDLHGEFFAKCEDFSELSKLNLTNESPIKEETQSTRKNSYYNRRGKIFKMSVD